MTLDEKQNLLLDISTYPDKIIYREELTKSVPLAAGIGDYTLYTIPHGLPTVPLIIGTYSDDDWVTSYDFGMGGYELLPTYGFSSYPFMVHAYSDSTNIYVKAISHNTARTIKIRLIGLLSGVASSTAKNITPPVQDNLLFDTDKNYLKHAYWSLIDQTTDGTGNYVSQAYSTTVSTPLTILSFIKEDGYYSYMNTRNAITQDGVEAAITTRANFVQLNVASFDTKTVTWIFKAYLDA